MLYFYQPFLIRCRPQRKKLLCNTLISLLADVVSHDPTSPRLRGASQDLFFTDKITHYQNIYATSNEGGVGIFGGGDDRLAFEVEGSVEEEGNSGLLMKSGNEAVIEGIGIFVDQLRPGGIVGMGDSRDFFSPEGPDRHDVEHKAEREVIC